MFAGGPQRRLLWRGGQCQVWPAHGFHDDHAFLECVRVRQTDAQRGQSSPRSSSLGCGLPPQGLLRIAQCSLCSGLRNGLLWHYHLDALICMQMYISYYLIARYILHISLSSLLGITGEPFGIVSIWETWARLVLSFDLSVSVSKTCFF